MSRKKEAPDRGNAGAKNAFPQMVKGLINAAPQVRGIIGFSKGVD
jgi:hypothetical protein